MAVVNLTPDSFSDGGRYLVEGAAGPAASVVVSQCERWLREGPLVLDLGGESTRPGAPPVSVETEIERVVPVLRALRERDSTREALVSVDTRHARVARAALDAGADIVNDISGLADPAMAGVVAEFGAGLVIGHLRGTPQDMQRKIHFDDLMTEVSDELGESLERAESAGVPRGACILDPCVGFGKTAEQSAALVASSAVLERRWGRPVLIGASRKSFLQALGGSTTASDRTPESLAAAASAVVHGAAMLRVHDVEPTRRVLTIAAGIERAWARHRPEEPG